MNAIADDRPTPADLMQRLRPLLPEIQARAEEVDRGRAVAPDMIERLREVDLFRVVQPKRYGGFEYPFSVFFSILGEIARNCTSTAWNYGNLALHQGTLGMFPEQAQEDFWGDNPATLISGSYAPSAIARPTKGGWLLSGTWGFASAIDFAQWHIVGAMLPSEKEAGKTAMAFLAVPMADCRIIDNWYTTGLRGTASKDVVLEDVFVPAHRVLPAEQFSTGTGPGAKLHQGILFRTPLLAFAPTMFAASALGAAEDALDTFRDMARVRTTKGALAGFGNRLAQFSAVQTKEALASGLLQASRLLLEHDIAEMEGTISAGDPLTLEQRIRFRRNQALAARFAREAVDAIDSCTGAQGLYLDTRIQRCWRDVHAISKHIALNWDAVSALSGMFDLGLEPAGTQF